LQFLLGCQTIHEYQTLATSKRRKDCWSKTLGIKVNLIEEPWNSFLRTIFSPEFEIGGYDLLTEYESPLYFMELFKNSHNNISRWENETYSRTLTNFQLFPFASKLTRFS